MLILILNNIELVTLDRKWNNRTRVREDELWTCALFMCGCLDKERVCEVICVCDVGSLWFVVLKGRCVLDSFRLFCLIVAPLLHLNISEHFYVL